MTEENRIANIESNQYEDKKETLFNFIKNPEKLNLLIKTNEILNLNKANHNKIIFVYSAPKVGSTSIVSSLRIFGSLYTSKVPLNLIVTFRFGLLK